MEDTSEKLIEAFREDHALLGSSFHELSKCLRANEAVAARRIAKRIDKEAGAHIAFEEEQFYPSLEPLLGEGEVARLHAEHRLGLAVIQTLIERDAVTPLDENERRRLLELSESMERHIAECGELFGAMERLPPDSQEELHGQLQDWRRTRPSWQTHAASRGEPPAVKQVTE
jgi:hypothetical protein